MSSLLSGEMGRGGRGGGDDEENTAPANGRGGPAAPSSGGGDPTPAVASHKRRRRYEPYKVCGFEDAGGERERRPACLNSIARSLEKRKRKNS